MTAYLVDLVVCLNLVFAVTYAAGRRVDYSLASSSARASAWHARYLPSSRAMPNSRVQRVGRSVRTSQTEVQMVGAGSWHPDWHLTPPKASQEPEPEPGFRWTGGLNPQPAENQKKTATDMKRQEWWNGILSQQSGKDEREKKQKKKRLVKQTSGSKKDDGVSDGFRLFPQKGEFGFSPQNGTDDERKKDWFPIFQLGNNTKVQPAETTQGWAGGWLSGFIPKNGSDQQVPDVERQKIPSVGIMAQDILLTWNTLLGTRGMSGAADTLGRLSDKLSGCEAYGLMYKQNLENLDEDEAKVLSLIAVDFEELPVDSGGILQDVAERTYGKRPSKTLKVVIIKGLVGWPGATKSTNLERNIVLLRDIVRMAYRQRRLVLLDPSLVWPAPQPQWPQLPRSRDGSRSQAELVNYFRGVGFQDVNFQNSQMMVYSREVPKESTQKVLVMVKLKTSSFRQTLADIFKGRL